MKSVTSLLILLFAVPVIATGGCNGKCSRKFDVVGSGNSMMVSEDGTLIWDTSQTPPVGGALVDTRADSCTSVKLTFEGQTDLLAPAATSSTCLEEASGPGKKVWMKWRVGDAQCGELKLPLTNGSPGGTLPIKVRPP